jgi:hypothetical protein
MALRIYLVFIALSLFSLSANAQADYLFPHDTASVFFNDTQANYFTAYIESTSIDELGAHYQLKGNFNSEWTTIQCWDTYCEAVNSAPGEFGSRYTASADSTHQFVTSSGDSLEFNFNMNVGESSIFFAGYMHYFITRLYDSTSDIWFQGEIVFNYEITVMNIYEEVITPFSGGVISIGLESGIHRFFDIQGFPEDYMEVVLVGNTYFDSGIVPFTFTEAFDFQLAEIYQYQKTSNLPGSHSSSIDTYTIMSRADMEGSVTYQIQKESITTVYMLDYEDIIPPEVTVTGPTMLESTYYDEQIAPNLYGPRYASQGISGYGLFESTDHYGEELLQLTVGIDEGYSPCDDDPNCFFETEDPDYRYKKYVPELGKVYEYFGIENYGWSEELVYFQKDGITWGLDGTSVEESGLETAGLRAYPNPSSGIVILSRPVQNAGLYNAMGQLVTYVNGSVLDVTACAEGLYLLKPSGKNETALRILKR